MSGDRKQEAPPAVNWLGPVSSPMLVVIASSAGSLGGLIEILGSLSADFPAAIAVVQHRGDQSPELLPELLQRRTELRVCHAEDGCLLEPGTVYVCPPGMHMETEHCLRLVEGPRVRHVRPSADLMIRSAVRTYGTRAVVVVLSGHGADGAVSCRALSELGGVVLVQEPSSCIASGMPSAALATDRAATSLPVHEIAEALQHIASATPTQARGSAAGSAGPKTVVLVDDHRITLDGLRALLNSEPDIEVIAEVDNGRDAVQLATRLLPDVVVMDVSMPDLDGVEATRKIRARSPGTAIVALSAHREADIVQRILAAGAASYVCKTDAFTELAVAIRSAVAGLPGASV